jgi:hypothetical protein
MASESCPRCGEKAISQTGHCVFCGAVVVAASSKPTGRDYDKALRTYRFTSMAFLVFGVIYLALAVIGTVALKSPMIGFFLAGAVTSIQGALLIMNHDWVRSVTKIVCSCRLGLFAFIVMVLAPYMLHMGPAGYCFFVVFVLDILCLILMIRTIDDVVFA